MSKQERLNLYQRLGEAMKRSTREMLERKVKLGENVVIADKDGNPVILSADEALRIFTNLTGE